MCSVTCVKLRSQLALIEPTGFAGAKKKRAWFEDCSSRVLRTAKVKKLTSSLSVFEFEDSRLILTVVSNP